MATKNNPGAFDCYAKAEPDEPLFVLLARDKHAPTLIWLWAVMRELDGEDPAKVREAQECAVAMMAWANERGRSVVGIGQAGLAAMCEMIRTINDANRKLGPNGTNDETSLEMMRRFLTACEFEKGDAA